MTVPVSTHCAVGSRILCVWFPDWPIQRLVVRQPELRQQKIILFRRDRQRGQLVSAASPLAQQSGVYPNMPLSEAKSLLHRSGPQKTFLFKHDPNRDRQSLQRLCESLEDFSPTVGLETLDNQNVKRTLASQQTSALLLDVTGLAHLFGDETQLACLLLKHLETRGYFTRIAIANTVGAAWASARFLANRHDRHCRQQQPLVIAADDEQTLLTLPVQGLRLNQPILDTLNQLGIESVGQLCQLSRNDLAMRFGNVIHRRIDQLFGDIQEPVAVLRPSASFTGEQLLEYPTRHRETIEVIIGRLVDQLCQQLKSQQRGALQWEVCLRCNSGPIKFTVGLFQPSTDVGDIMPLVEMQLETAFRDSVRRHKKRKLIKFEVNKIWVAVPTHVLLVQQQRQLFDQVDDFDGANANGQHTKALSHLINRLAGRLGNENVVYPTLQSDAQPEYSFRLKPLVDVKRKRRRKRPDAKPGSHRLARPIRLIQPPQPIQVDFQPATPDTRNVLADPTRVCNLHRPPNALTVDGNRDCIVNAWGPERIETGWWRGGTVCRDYWRIATETGQQFWIYRDLKKNRWWLHGKF